MLWRSGPASTRLRWPPIRVTSVPDFAYWGLVTLQVILAVFLIFLMVRLVRIIRGEGGTIIPRRISAKLRGMFGRSNR